MLLTRLSDYLRGKGRASLNDMALGVGSTPEALAVMLALLERRGRVRLLPAGSACGSSGCNGCDSAKVAIYEWAGPK